MTTRRKCQIETGVFVKNETGVDSTAGVLFRLASFELAEYLNDLLFTESAPSHDTLNRPDLSSWLDQFSAGTSQNTARNRSTSEQRCLPKHISRGGHLAASKVTSQTMWVPVAD